MSAQFCSDCPAPITRASKTGRCRKCASRRTALNPAKREKCADKMREHYSDPAYAARMGQAVKQGWARRLADPAKREEAKLNALRFGAAGTPPGSEARRKGGRTRSEKALAWCPPELRAEYRDLCRRRSFRAAEARAILEPIIPGTQAHAKRFIANTNLAMRIKQEREKAQAY